MNPHYFPYCLADRLFYDHPWSRKKSQVRYRQANEIRSEDGDDLTTAPVDVWVTWNDGPWCHYSRKGEPLPHQGWKIHVSATPPTAQEILDITSDYCLSRGISFKFLVSESALMTRNSKYADRAASGKFITIYPATDEVLRTTLAELSEKLRGFEGPYILSDARWKDGPLHVRYGAFALRYVRDGSGQRVPAITTPDGRLVPDLREPVFRYPDWVRPPAFLAGALDAEHGRIPEDFPYRIRSALHFSNGGGIYLAEDTRDGARVVLKEARPHAGLDRLGRDAVARLRHERDHLARLAGVEHVAALRDYRTVWEHHFLVQEHVDGGTLSEETVSRHPLVHPDPGPERVAAFTRWALEVTGRVEDAVRRLHERGVAFGDLHPGNVLVRDDGRIALIDLELASTDGDRSGSGMGAPGFVPPDRRGAFAADRYALACLRIATFLPLTALFGLDTTTAARLVDAVERIFPVPRGWGAGVRADLDLGGSPWAGTDREMARSAELVTGGPHGPDWGAIEASVVRAIEASATPDRTDRLFPGDVRQLELSGVGLAHGAAGVIHAVAASGHGRRPAWEDWLVRCVRDRAPDRPHLPGLYDGLHGAAHALAAVGRSEDAMAARELAQRATPEDVAVDLYSGLAGMALNDLDLAGRLGDSGLRAAAVDTAQRVADRLLADDPATGRAGLLHGRSGCALLFVRLYEDSGDDGYLDLAARALRADLRHCVRLREDDALLVDEGARSLPYVEDGSAGIGLALVEFLRHRRDHPFRDALARIRRAAEPGLAVHPMLFRGSAGLMGFLAALRRPEAPDERLERAIALKRDRLRWHMVGLRGEVAFPGDQLMRISMDLATGGAGILLALAAERGEPGTPLLPLLSPGAARPVTAPVPAPLSPSRERTHQDDPPR